MIEAPEAFQESLTIPADHLAACAASGIPTAGNAAGNTDDLFDLSGARTSPQPLPAGFTARGIVALVFSCVSALLGVAVIVWYGVGEIGTKEEGILEGRIEDVARRLGVAEVAESPAVVRRRAEGAGMAEI